MKAITRFNSQYLSRSVVFACVVGFVVAGCASRQLSGPLSTPLSSDRWVSTWGASPTVPVPNAPSYENQTLRLIVHTSLGGDEVRVRISNAFGAQPLVIGDASVALSAIQGAIQSSASNDASAALLAGSNRSLTFSGRRSFTIPPYALVVSDPVKLAVPATQTLAVSIFFPGATGPMTVHPLATQISYLSSAGNFVASNDAAAFSTPIQAWPFLAGVEVKSKSTARAVVTFGDSITDGFKSTVNGNRRWPDNLAKRLLAAGRNVAVVNEGISGNRLLHDAAAPRPTFGPNALSRFDRDVLAQSAVSHVIVLIGINDIGNGVRVSAERVSASDITSGMQQLILRAHAKGLKIIGATLTPFEGAGYFSEDGERDRQAVNQWIRASKEFDGVIDFDLATRDPSHPARFLPAYDSGDHLHPSDAGYQAMAYAIDLSLLN